MVSACVVVVAAFVNGPVMEQAQFQDAIGAFQRLVAAVPPLKAGATREERSIYQASKAELESLHIYLGKVREVMAIGKYDESYRSNVVTVARQLVETAAPLTVFPEEALCWQRVALRIAALNREMVLRRVEAGKLPEWAMRQANATYLAARKSYHQTLARCLESID